MNAEFVFSALDGDKEAIVKLWGECELVVKRSAIRFRMLEMDDIRGMCIEEFMNALRCFPMEGEFLTYYSACVNRRLRIGLFDCSPAYVPIHIRDEMWACGGCEIDRYVESARSALFGRADYFYDAGGELVERGSVESFLERYMQDEDFYWLLSLLEERERCVLTALYGLSGEKPAKLAAVAVEQGVSVMAVVKVRDKALRKLRYRISEGEIKKWYKKT